MTSLDTEINEASPIVAYQTALREIEGGALSDLPLDAQNPEIGLSGKKLISSLQRLTSIACHGGDDCYVEVGTYRGLTLLSVASANPTVPCFGIDNFSQFDPSGENERTVLERSARMNIRNASLIKSDFEDALLDLASYIGARKIGAYMVDGPHDYRSQLVCLTLARRRLAKNAVIFIDDSNYEHVRQANKDFLLAFPEFKLLFEAYGAAHPNNLPASAHREARNDYWNGINILVHDPEDTLEPIYPPTGSDKTRHLNEHIIHASRMAEAAPEAMLLAEALFKPWRFPRAAADIWKQRTRWKNEWSLRFADSNTDSTKTTRYAQLRGTD